MNGILLQKLIEEVFWFIFILVLLMIFYGHMEF